MMGIVLAVLAYVLTPYFGQSLPIKISALIALLGGGALTYAVAVQVTGVLKLSDIKRYLKRKA
jgi:hypothetical protein